ncbi:MAG: hypothetical protein ACT4OU_07590 [Hyphomicrobium sp.]
MTLIRHATGPAKSLAVMRKDRQLAKLMWIATLAVAAALAAPAPARADAFSALKGGWSGGGSAKFTGGQSEKLRCTARYSGGGTNLALNIKCASASANINLTGNLSANGNRVSGGWNENSFGLSGSAAGSRSATGVRLKISGSTSGYLTLSVAGNSHSFALSSQGTPLTGVHVSMRRR